MPSSSSLDSLGVQFGTDKSSKYHDYLEFYEMFLQPLRDLPIRILEVGVLNGASLRTWEAYFPNARIVGADIDPSTRRFATDRTTIEIVDQSDLQELTNLAVKHGPFDLVIEDGSHLWEHQTTTLRTLFPFVKDDGLYIVEDLQTNYGALAAQYKGVATTSCVEFLKTWLDLRVATAEVDLTTIEDAFLRTYGRSAQMLAFFKHACLIKKRLPPPPERRTDPNGTALLPPDDRPGGVGLAIVGHVSDRGDMTGVDGLLNPGAAFQGLAIRMATDIVEYRVRRADDRWSEWVGANTFVGTRGQAILLTGVAVRLRPAFRRQYAVTLAGRFEGHAETIAASERGDCVSPNGAALTGLQLDIRERAPIA